MQLFHHHKPWSISIPWCWCLPYLAEKKRNVIDLCRLRMLSASTVNWLEIVSGVDKSGRLTINVKLVMLTCAVKRLVTVLLNITLCLLMECHHKINILSSYVIFFFKDIVTCLSIILKLVTMSDMWWIVFTCSTRFNILCKVHCSTDL